MKSSGFVRRLDLLGRVVLPKSLRDAKKLDIGVPVEISVNGEYIVLERYIPKCVFCGNPETLVYKEKHICSDCIAEIRLTIMPYNSN